MTQSWFVALTSALAIGLFVGMLLLLEVGRRLGLRESARHGTSARSGVGVVDGVVYSLLGLLIGFTFSGAANRFDARRLRIGDVVHAIGVAWEAIDVLPPESQPPIRAGFKQYLEALLAADTTQEEPVTVADKFLEASDVTKARHAVWLQAVAAVSVPSGERARLILLPALREMFVSAERERIARLIHPPKIIYLMLGLTALAAAPAGRLRIRDHADPQLDLHARHRRRRVDLHLRHPRPRVPADRARSRRSARPGASGSPPELEVTRGR